MCQGGVLLKRVKRLRAWGLGGEVFLVVGGGESCLAFEIDAEGGLGGEVELESDIGDEGAG